ncbi:unnamed protein product [Closterium sp. NIES-65]|nr:unnamed protein product [Closterium sp. NIES-65]
MRQRSDAIGLVVIDEEDNPTLLLRSDAIGLVVIDEEDNATLLVHRISADDIYQRQEDTIISWTDPEVATDLALSFQESMGCSYICLLCSIVPDPFISRSLLSRSSPAGSKYATCSAKCRCLQALREEGLEHVTRLQFMRHPPKMVGYLNGGLLNALEAATDMSELPAVELRNLPVIAKMLTDVPLFHKDRIASLVLREGYVPKLLDLFRQCEDLENLDGLHHLYRIAKGLVLLNDTNLFDLLFADNAILDLVGALEYGPDLPSRQQHRKFLLEQVEFHALYALRPDDPDLPSQQQHRKFLLEQVEYHDPDLPSRQQHRKFLLEQVEYREAVPIQDPSLRSKIHQTYRLGYIKDVILPRVLDDQTYGTFNSLILFNNVEVVSTLQGDKPFLSDLFSQLRSKDPSSPAFRDLVRFLQEFCSLHKHLQITQRNQSFSPVLPLAHRPLTAFQWVVLLPLQLPYHFSSIHCCPPLFSSIHCCPPLFSSIHCCPPLFSSIHCCPPLFSSIHCCPPLFSSIHCCPPLFSSIHCCPPLFSSIHCCPPLFSPYLTLSPVASFVSTTLFPHSPSLHPLPPHLSSHHSTNILMSALSPDPALLPCLTTNHRCLSHPSTCFHTPPPPPPSPPTAEPTCSCQLSVLTLPPCAPSSTHCPMPRPSLLAPCPSTCLRPCSTDMLITDMLMSALSPDPAPLRTFLVEQPGHTLFSCLVRRKLFSCLVRRKLFSCLVRRKLFSCLVRRKLFSCLVRRKLFSCLVRRKLFSCRVKGMVERSQGEGGSHVQLLEILRQLLDTDTMDTAEKNKFLDVFYEEYVDVLVKGITTAAAAAAAVGGGGGGSGGGGLGGGVVSPAPEVLASICDLLCFCVLHHSFRMKYYVLRNNVVEKVLRLVRRKERYLVVAAVRFLRSCISLKDDFYLRYLVKNRLFEPVIAAFRANGSRYNLLNSAVLDLVEFIRKENIKSLVTHLVETYGSWFDSVDYVDSFKLLRLKYEQVRGEWAHGRGGMGAWEGRNGRMGGEEWAHGRGGMGAWGGRNGRMGGEEWAHGGGGMGAWGGRNGRMGREEWAHGRGGMGAWEGRNGRMGGEEWAHGRGGMGAWEGRNGRMGGEGWAHGRGGMGAWEGRNGRMGVEEWAHGRGGMGAWGGRNGRMGGEEWAHGRGGMGAWEGRNGRMGGGGMGAWGGRNGRMGGEEWAHGRGGMGAWGGRNGRMGGEEWAHGRGGMGAWEGRNGRMGGEEWAHGRGGMGAWEGRNGRMGGDGGHQNLESMRPAEEPSAPHFFTPPLVSSPLLPLPASSFPFPTDPRVNADSRRAFCSTFLHTPPRPLSSPPPSFLVLPLSQQNLESMRPAEEPSAAPPPSHSNLESLRPAEEPSAAFPLSHLLSTSASLAMPHCFSPAPPLPPPFLSQQNLESMRPAEEPSAAPPPSHLPRATAISVQSSGDSDEDEPAAQEEEHDDSLPVLDPSGTPPLPRHKSRSPSPPRSLANGIIPPEPSRKPLHGLVDYEDEDDEDRPSSCSPFPPSPRPSSGSPASGRGFEAREEARGEARGEARNGPKRSGTGGAGSGGKDGSFQVVSFLLAQSLFITENVAVAIPQIIPFAIA